MKALPILIMGLSGSGKSTAIKYLNPEETFLINCGNKPLPFKGENKLYTDYSQSKNPKGNLLTTDNYNTIEKMLHIINTEREDIKTILFDDSQELIIHEFMEKHTEHKGNAVFDMYSDIADHFYYLIYDLRYLRKDLVLFFLHHAELSEDNLRMVPKTIGKFLNQKIVIPSMFTIVLYATKENNGSYFLTQNDGTHPAKSPEGMFDNVKIMNNLQLVRDAATLYFEGD